MNILELRAKRAESINAAKALVEKAKGEARELTEAEQVEADAALTEVDRLSGVINNFETNSARAKKIDDLVADLNKSAGRSTEPGEARSTPGDGDNGIPKNAKRYGRLRNFKDEKSAYRFGQFWRAINGVESARQWCKDYGVELRGHTENVNSAGGFLVPEEFSTEMIDLREQYGVFRRNAKVIPMTRDTYWRPRRTGGLTAYFVAESVAGTESTKSWDRVTLTAKDLIILSKTSNNLAEDAIISVGDDLAGEISYAFALKEDDCGFNGDGTSTYGGIVGIRAAFAALSGTIANIAGLQVGSGNAYSELALVDFEGVMGRLPVYAEQGAKWYCHKGFYHSTMLRLQVAAGGATMAEIGSGAGRNFLGYPVEFVQVMPKVEANSQIPCVFGSLDKAADFGDRRMTTIDVSDSALNAFEKNEIAIRGTERFDINVHDVGNASATAALQVAGPLVGLITAAS